MTETEDQARRRVWAVFWLFSAGLAATAALLAWAASRGDVLWATVLTVQGVLVTRALGRLCAGR